MLRVLLIALLVGGTHATTFRQLNLREMAERAEIAFYGQVESVSSEDRDGQPWTVVRFEVLDDLLGDLEPNEGGEGESVTRDLAFFGGTLEGGQTVAVNEMPDFQQGQEVIVFAYDAPYYSPIVGFSQGLWRLQEGQFSDAFERTLQLDPQGVATLQAGQVVTTEQLREALRDLLAGRIPDTPPTPDTEPEAAPEGEGE